MRSRRGTIRVRARCLAVDPHGRILVQMTPDGVVEIPGGRVEYDEFIPFCLVREMSEEAGISIEPRELVYIVEFRGDKRGRARHEILFYFKCEVRGTPHSKEKGLNFTWMKPEELPAERFWPRPLLEYLLADAPAFPRIRFIAINGERVEYILSRGLLERVREP